MGRNEASRGQLPDTRNTRGEQKEKRKLGRSHRAFCNAKKYNGMEASVAYRARRDALVRERSIVVNSRIQHPAWPPC
jgi:hypothetical protein